MFYVRLVMPSAVEALHKYQYYLNKNCPSTALGMTVCLIKGVSFYNKNVLC